MPATFLTLLIAHAAPRAALDDGDRAWCAGQRGDAAAQWREAAAGDPAIAAMAELRLLLVSGNLGMAVHGPRAEAALAMCPAGEAWCDLARADYEILLSLQGLPSDLDEARYRISRAAEALPGPAQARSVWIGDAQLDTLAALKRDGLGDGLLAANGWPRGPGSWFIGLGVSGAPGLGIGGGVRFVHPDLRYTAWRLTTDAFLTSRGTGQLSAQLTTSGTLWSVWSLRGGRLIVDSYALGESRSVWTVNALVGPGVRWGKSAAWIGPMLRVDHTDGDRLDGHGLSAGLSRRVPGLWLSGRIEQTLGADYEHTLLMASGTASHTWEAIGLHGRLAGALAPGSEAPWWRLPSAGGGVNLRSAPLGRWRGTSMLAVAAEIRVPIMGPLGGVLFAEAALIEGLHSGAGGGLRLHLPPRPHGTLRLDVGVGEEGAMVTAGWGEAF